jgi:hypothetical protein
MGGLPGHAPGAWHEKKVRETEEEKKKDDELF